MKDGNAPNQPFLVGGGETGELMRSIDWSKTWMGPTDSWPQSLKVALQIMLHSRFPMFIWWGKELTYFYNDAYLPTLGIRHPKALGLSAMEVWSEIWSDLRPQVEAVVERGEASWNEELLLFLERSGFSEETYHTFSYSPIPNDAGGVGGLYCAVMEVTAQVISRRRLQTLRDLSERSLMEAKNIQEVCRTAAKTLAENAKDIPFALLYLLDENGKTARLAEAILPDLYKNAILGAIEIGGEVDVWHFHKILETNQLQLINDVETKIGQIKVANWKESWTQQAAVLPLEKAGIQAFPAGFLVAGISPRQSFDNDYQGFIELAAGHVASAIANAHAIEEERKRAEALAELDRAKTTFFSNVSHEFRTPLTLMLSPLEDVLNTANGNLPIEYRENLDIAHRNALRLLKLVNTLLDFSRIESNRIQASYEPLDLCVLTKDLASNFRSAIEKAGMELIIDCEDLGAPVYADREMWEKIVLNLMSNAFKYTLEGTIEVKLRAADGHAVLSVKDTGVGIGEEEVEHIFKRFHRVQNVQGRTHEGTGIGLSLVQELVHIHKGSIWVNSELGEGSTFTVIIPMGTAHLSAAQLTTPPTSIALGTIAKPYIEEALRWLPDVPESLDVVSQSAVEEMQTESDSNDKRPYILLADDNADIRDYIKKLLQPQYEVKTANDGVEALQLINEKVPDLILSDIMMPRMDGIALLKQLKQNPKTALTPVILLSARAGEEAQMDGLESGADDYLIKPFSAKELMTRVQTHLRIAAIRSESEQRLRNFILQAPVSIAILNADYVFEMANNQYFQLVNRSQEEVIGKSTKEVFPELSGHIIKAILQKVIQSNEPYFGNEYPVPLVRNGKTDTSYFNFVYQPLSEPDGFVHRVIVTATEVTEQVLARKKVEESEQRLQIATQAAQLGVWEYDIQKDTALWEGHRMHEIFGFEPTDTPLDTNTILQEFIHPADVESATKDLETTFATGKPLHSIYRSRRKNTDGWIWLEQNARVEYDTNNIPARMVGVTADITERKRAEQALQASEERFRGLQQAMPDGFMIFESVRDQAGAIEDFRWAYVNPAAEQIVQRTAADLVGKFLLQEMPGNRTDGLFDAYTQVVETGEIWRREFQYQHEGLDHFFVSTAVKTDDGFAVSFSDISEKKRAENNINYQKKLLEASTESVLDGILMVSPQGKMLHFNQQFLNIWNFPPAIIEAQSDELALQYAANETADPAAFLARVTDIYSQPNQQFREEMPMKDGRVYERFGAPIQDGETRLGWVWTFRDITERKKAEEKLRFLVALNQALLPLVEPDQIMSVTAQMLGEHLQVNRCAYAEVEADENHFRLIGDYTQDTFSMIGDFTFSSFGAEVLRLMRANEPYIINNVTEDPRTQLSLEIYHQTDIAAVICFPLHKDGKFTAVMAVHQKVPRNWTQEEVELVQLVVNRCWEALERTQVMRNLRESYQFNQTVLDSLSEHLAVLDKDGVITSVNEAWKQFAIENGADWTMKGVGVGTNYLDVCRVEDDMPEAEDARVIYQGLQGVLNGTSKFFSVEYPCHSPMDKRWFFLTVSPLTHGGGGAVVSHLNVTSRRLAEESLRESEERYRAFVSQSSEAIWRCEIKEPLDITLQPDELIRQFYQHGYLAECNDEMAKLYGFDKAEQIIGARLGEMLPSDEEVNIEYLRAFIASDYRLTEAESHEIDRHGQPHYFLNNLIGIVENGYLCRAWGTQQDITKRKQAEEALKESRIRLQLALDSANVGIHEWHPKTGKIIWDKRVKICWGLPLDQEPDYDIFMKGVHPSDRKGTQAALDKATDPNGDGKYYAEYRVIGISDGIERWLAASGQVFFEEQQPIRLVGTVIDITKIKRTQETLYASEERLRIATISTGLGTFDLNLDTNELTWDNRTRELFGLSPDTFVDMNVFYKGLHPDDMELTEKVVNYSLQPESNGDYDIEYRTIGIEDQKLRWIRAKGKVFFEANIPHRFIGTVLDITDRKTYEDKLIESEQRFRYMADTVPVMIWITDADGQCTYLNSQWYDYTGQAEQEALGLGWTNATHPDDTQMAGEVFMNASEQRIPFYFEYRLMDKNGGYRWMLDAGLPRYSESGKFEGFIGAVTDIHERKLIEEALSESEQKFKKLADAAPVLIWQAGLDKGCYYFNQVWLDFTGRTMEQVIGNGWADDVHPDDMERCLDIYVTAFDKREKFEMEYRLKRYDGQYRWLLDQGVPIYDSSGTFTGYIGSCVDINDKKLAEEQKDAFMRIAGHELRTPLTSLLGYLSLMQKSQDSSPAIANYLQKCYNSSVKMRGLITDFLDVSKVQQGQLSYEISIFDFDALVLETVDNTQLEYPLHSIGIQGKTGKMFQGDRRRIEQVIANLLNNAIKYSPGKDRIDVMLQQEDHQLTLKIKDYGIGIEQKETHKIFDKFYRAPGRNKIKGMGLGLYIVKQIIDFHNGSIQVESKMGEGTTFVVQLPLESDAM